jgi:hypothetical protein
LGVGLTTLPCKKENGETSKIESRILCRRPWPSLGYGAKERRKKERKKEEGEIGRRLKTT